MSFLYGNNGSSLLATAINNIVTVVTVTATQGSRFPATAAGKVMPIVVEDVSGNIEVMYATSRTGDSLTVQRGQEGTTAIPFAVGSRVELRLTAAVLNSGLQKNGGDTLSGTTDASSAVVDISTGLIENGEIAGSPMRASVGETDNQILIPVAAEPTASGSPIVTAANIGNHTPAGAAYLLAGMVVVWAGLSTNVPTGFRICDGSNATPDLRDFFIVGGGGSLPPSGGDFSGLTGATDAITGVSIGSHVLDITELPAHTHKFTYMFSDFAGHTPNGGGQTYGTFSFALLHTTSTGGGLGHTHALTGGGSHTHTVTLPPYRGIFFIMKQ